MNEIELLLTNKKAVHQQLLFFLCAKYLYKSVISLCRFTVSEIK